MKVPCDSEGSFETVVVPKRKIDVSAIENINIALNTENIYEEIKRKNYQGLI